MVLCDIPSIKNLDGFPVSTGKYSKIESSKSSMINCTRNISVRLYSSVRYSNVDCFLRVERVKNYVCVSIGNLLKHNSRNA